ncbi:pyrimidine 5-nucleotidase [Suillus fuscotomentosus]|uniref:Pyrimidine 5-nucleotidase n=1 Tax=Suillus fuscotomentosus TaxID=1912939 RepID=A0AAD4HR72_9AGAM|nr:pyrimidine 5-nucleotidase [Suillus fuscotomentosus]KAG1907095.1 pyrimidine 5-nucleotidase [Suillus fuscotomentosus]
MSPDATPKEDPRLIVWFDIDNTLYSASTKISQAMGQRIHAYFVALGLDEDEASELHHSYYTQYGLALRGLTRYHNIDPMDFDRKCDGTLPLDDLIKPDPRLRKLFQDLDRTKVRVWALTNAYKTHAQRVLKILDLEDQIEGLVYCDYQQIGFTCKPEPDYYHNAMKQADVSDPCKCYFVDDSQLNVRSAKELGWGHCVHFCEAGLEIMDGGKTKKLVLDTNTNDPQSIRQISDLEELRTLWPEIFI